MAASNAYPQAEVDAMIAFLGRRAQQLRAALEESDQLACAGETVGYESAYRILRRAVAEFLVAECPSCHQSGGERYRSGKDIRQKEDGSLTCLACGRVVVPPEHHDVR